MKVLIDGLSESPHISIGSQAMMLGAMKIIERKFPGSEYHFISGNPDVESWYLKQGDFKISIQKRKANQLQKIYQFISMARKVDVIVTVWGDAFAQISPHLLWRKAFIFKHSHKPLIMFTATIGPFSNGWRNLLAKKGLTYFDAITVREPNTLNFLKSLGIDSAQVYPDTAYAWPVASDERAREILQQENVQAANGIVGLNISILLHHIFKNKNTLTTYEEAMCQLIYHLQSHTGMHVILLPHQIYYPGYDAPKSLLESKDGDDRIACEWVYKSLMDKSGISIIKGCYTVSEYKAIMKQCEIFIGGRMHSVVGAVSTGTPSIVMQYSHKAKGVMKMIGMEDYVWNIKNSIEDCKLKVNKLWTNRFDVRNQLSKTIPAHIEGSFSLGEVLSKVMFKNF
jgi:colanic acid/amylovoran biosynthesis protein